MGTAVVAALFASVLTAAGEPRQPLSPVEAPCRVLAPLEIGLARAPALYAVVDASARRIELKARGVVLRRFPLRGASSIGRTRARLGPSALVAKLPLVESMPQMPAPPGDATSREKAAEEAPLTVAAMPARYQLVFEDGLSLMVHPGGAAARSQRLLDGLGAMGDWMRARATLLAGQLTGAPRRVLIVELTAEEARAFYWAVRPPLPVLLRIACPRGPGPDR